MIKRFRLKKNWNTIVPAVILGGLSIISVICLSGTIKECANLNFSKNKMIKAIRAYYSTDTFPPSEIMLKYYLDRKEKILEYHNAFKALFLAQKEMPSRILDTLKFKEELINVQFQIRKEAEREYLMIKDEALSLGFERYETEIPLPQDIPDLMLELHAIKELASFMMDSRVDVLEKLRTSNPQDKTLPGEENPFIRIYPVQITIQADFESFVRFLDYCGKSNFIFALSDLHICQSEAGENMVKADMTFNAVVFL